MCATTKEPPEKASKGHMAIKRVAEGEKVRAAAAVEGPLCVVRELVDNAIDAGATTVSVTLDTETGGLEQIQVTDDGTGIYTADFPLVFAPNASSMSGSLGFRGEALHLISELADACHVTSRTADDPTALQWASYDPKTIKRLAAPRGTTLTVQRIFARLTARRKMLLKKPGYAAINAIEIFLKQYAVIHSPHIRFTLKTRSKSKSTTVFVTPLNSTSTKLLSQWSHIKFLTAPQVHPGALATAKIALPAGDTGTSPQHVKELPPVITINKRLMNPRLHTGKALRSVVSGLYKERGSQVPATYAIFVTVHPTQVDENIEPKKDDVLLRDHDRVLGEVELCLRKVLDQSVTHTQLAQSSDILARSDQIATSMSQSHQEFAIRLTQDPKPHSGSTIDASANTTSTGCPISDRVSGADESWSRTMHDALFSEKDPWEDSQPQDFEPIIDEDLLLAKDNTISNPFTLTRMRNARHVLRAQDGYTADAAPQAQIELSEAPTKQNNAPIPTHKPRAPRPVNFPARVVNPVTHTKKNHPSGRASHSGPFEVQPRISTTPLRRVRENASHTPLQVTPFRALVRNGDVVKMFEASLAVGSQHVKQLEIRVNYNRSGDGYGSAEPEEDVSVAKRGWIEDFVSAVSSELGGTKTNVEVEPPVWSELDGWWCLDCGVQI